MKLKYIIYTLLVVGFGSLIVYRIVSNKGGGKGASAKTGKAGGQPMRVDGVVVEPRNFSNSLAVTGTIEANEQVQLRSEISGLIRGIYFREGSNVTRGQTLLTIDDSELRAQLAQAVTKQNLAGENEKRARLLLQKEAISREEYDASLAEFRSLRSQTALVKAQLAKTVIKAPFNGKIGLRAVSVGEYLVPTTVVANLVNTNPVKITFNVPEKYAMDVKVNTDVDFTVSGLEKKYTAKVYAIEPQVETNTRTLRLRARAENPGGGLVPGLFANIQLPLSNIEKAILVPTEAIIPEQEGKKVLVSKNGKAEEVKVATSTRTEKEILITSGLKAGDTVLTTGIMALKAGSPVQVKIDNK
ncbi:efflux RND transporter periplasmic adaptor subunit [Desertivirga xinjiangensis]|uniref:efflux RND transporter periplasmic adaptor subunit n=1 Tax=Desertivirga xinjiangensis TaxID=539206 RepID=UPI0021087A32|nr:efflux RND transporter periplasmic adaptor subunit [Pedobacter xinjiangensis]